MKTRRKGTKKNNRTRKKRGGRCPCIIRASAIDETPKLNGVETNHSGKTKEQIDNCKLINCIKGSEPETYKLLTLYIRDIIGHAFDSSPNKNPCGYSECANTGEENWKKIGIACPYCLFNWCCSRQCSLMSESEGDHKAEACEESAENKRLLDRLGDDDKDGGDRRLRRYFKTGKKDCETKCPIGGMKRRRTRKKRGGGNKSKKIKEIVKIFQQYPDIFPRGYFRFLSGNLEKHEQNGTLIYKNGVVLTYTKYKKRVNKYKKYKIKKGDVKLNQLVNKNQGNGKARTIFLAFMKKHSNTNLLLDVRADNKKAIRFYRKNGFNKIADTKFGDIKGIVMLKCTKKNKRTRKK